MQVEWAPYRYDDGYMISSIGNVYSILSGKLLEPFQVGNYIKVEIRGRQKFVHVLVAETFIGLRPKGMICRHLDGDPGNNDMFNLAWGTHEENVQDSRDHGTFRKLKGTECQQSKLNAEQVRAIRAICKSGRLSQAVIGRLFKISQGSVCRIANRLCYKDVL